MRSPDELLVRLLRPASIDEAIRGIGADTWPLIADLARAHRVSGLLLHRLRERALDQRLPAPVLDAMQRYDRRSAIRVLHLHRSFLELSSHLEAAGIQVIALKGLHLGATVYPVAGMRRMWDIDVLVRRDDALRARAAAVALGYSSPRSSAEVDLATQHHFATMSRRRVHLEIHWRLTPLAFGPDADLQGVMSRAAPFRMGQHNVLGLAPPDLLLHLCAHTSYQHLFEKRLVSLWDLALTVTRYRTAWQWETIAERARAWGIARGTSLTLHMAADLADADIPQRTIEAHLGGPPPPDVLEAARAQIFRPNETGLFSHHLTRVMDAEVPLRDRLKLLADRAFLAGSAVTAPAETKATGAWVFRLYRSVRLAWTYSARIARAMLPGGSKVSEIAARRNAVARWLDPPN